MLKVRRLFHRDTPKLRPSATRNRIDKKYIKFDPEFYARKYAAMISPNTDPHTHYTQYGIAKKLWPNPYFDPEYYISRYPSELAGITDVFSYFLDTGLNQDHIPIPHFSPRWYLKRYSDVKKAGINPYLHFVRYGDQEGRYPGPNFDRVSYLNSLAKEAIFPESAFQHWLAHQVNGLDYENEILRQLISDADMVDEDFYYRRYGDMRLSGGTAIDDFVLHGARTMRSPNSITDMRLIDLVIRDKGSDSNKFLFYMKNLYNYDLDHEQNNYALWREYFGYTGQFKAISGTPPRKAVAAPDVAAIIKMSENSINHIEDVVRHLRACIGCSTKIYAIIPVDLKQDIIIALRAIAAGLTGVDLITNEDRFQSIVKDFDFLLTMTDTVLLDPSAISILIQSTLSKNTTFSYSDHDHFVDGYFQHPTFKPRFSPTYLRNEDYCGPLLLARRSNLTGKTLEAMWNKSSHAASYDDDHVLLTDRYDVGHEPFILYHVIGSPRAEGPFGHSKIEQAVTELRSVTIIIPMRDKHNFTKICIESVLTYTDYPRDLIKIIIVDNNSIEDESIQFLNRLRNTANFKIVDYKGAFNFSKINNFAVNHVESDVVVFLNNDTSVIDGQWLAKLIHHASQPDIGAVGAKLVYEDDTIQHGGCIVGAAGGYVEHLLVGRSYKDPTIVDKTREMSTITGACIAIETRKFREIGGFHPVLRVAWNDVFLCLSCLEHGYRNIYISDALLYHFESKSRGFDDTSEQKSAFAREAAFTRMYFKKYFLDDPAYNSNLSLESAGKLALPPRNLKPWLRGAKRPKKVLMLSCVYNIGYGVPVVMERHAQRMVEQGWDVHIGGPLGSNEIQFDGCTRAIFDTPMEAACYAYQHDIPIIVSHTPPFFRVTDYVGLHVAVICYDYGEPNPKLFDLATMHYLEGVNRDKLLAFSLANKVVAISKAVKSEGKFLQTSVVGLGNDHLAVWADTMTTARVALRKKLGWEDKKVVLNVCRFPKTERYYKGLDKYVEVMNQFNFSFGSKANDYVWVLAGAAGPDDVAEMQNLGLEVYANLSNKDLADLYKAVDVYMSFSKWEGYNLGIGQALAMGLPVVASDIEAHREFPIFTSNSGIDVAVWLDQQFHRMLDPQYTRKPIIFEWSQSANAFEELMSQVFHDLIMRDERFGSALS